MVTLNPAEVAVPKELADLADLAKTYASKASFLPSLFLRPYRQPDDLRAHLLIHPLVYTAVFGQDEIPMICFAGSIENTIGGTTFAHIGFGREPDPERGVFVDISYESRSPGSTRITPSLKAQYQKVLGRIMPNTVLLTSNGDLFRNVPCNLEEIARVAFTVIKEKTNPIRFSVSR